MSTRGFQGSRTSGRTEHMWPAPSLWVSEAQQVTTQNCCQNGLGWKSPKDQLIPPPSLSQGCRGSHSSSGPHDPHSRESSQYLKLTYPLSVIPPNKVGSRTVPSSSPGRCRGKLALYSPSSSPLPKTIWANASGKNGEIFPNFYFFAELPFLVSVGLGFSCSACVSVQPCVL